MVGSFNVLGCLKIAAAGIGAGISYYLGGFDQALIILIILMVADYATGIMAGIYNKRINSKVGAKGIIKKLMIIVLVGAATLLDIIIGVPENAIRTAFIFFFMANELISIIENAGRCGITIPDFFENAVDSLKGGDPHK